MPVISEFYKGKLVAAKDLKEGQSIKGIITSCYLETPTGKDSDGKPRVVIEITDGDYRFQLNKGNAMTLRKEMGDDTDDWIGKSIIVTLCDTTYNQRACKGLEIHVDLKVKKK